MSSRLEIIMACHYASSYAPYAAHDFQHRNSPAVDDIHRRWLRKGFIVPASDRDAAMYGTEYVGTEALKVWTEAMMEVAEPIQVLRWEIPQP
jgi:hypothetical protein